MLDETLYQRTGEPDLPHQYEGLEERSEMLAVLADYALSHGKGTGIEVEDVDWENLLR